MTTYIIYNIVDGTYSYTDKEQLAMGAIPSEDLIVADVSHWDDNDMEEFANHQAGDQIGQLEGIELFDEIKANLKRNPL